MNEVSGINDGCARFCHSANSSASHGSRLDTPKARHLCFETEKESGVAFPSSFSKRAAPAVFAIAVIKTPSSAKHRCAIANPTKVSSLDFPGKNSTVANLPDGLSVRIIPPRSQRFANGLSGCQAVKIGNSGCGSAPRKRIFPETARCSLNARTKVSSAGFIRDLLWARFLVTPLQ